MTLALLQIPTNLKSTQLLEITTIYSILRSTVVHYGLHTVGNMPVKTD